MPTAAVPDYLRKLDHKTASPGLRFGMLFPYWGVDRDTHQVNWGKEDRWKETHPRDGRTLNKKEENKRPAIEAVCDLAPSKSHELAQKLNARAAAAARRMNESTGTPVFELTGYAVAPFATGLGNEHPLENGFAFLNPYGLPYLAGSGVKGVLRETARQLSDGRWEDSLGWSSEPRYPVRFDEETVLHLSMIDLLFGRESDDHDTEHFRGVLSFWDVLPEIEGGKLRVEVMTAHQSHYYQGKTDRDTPHESGSPNPIYFLTVPPGSAFAFRVSCDLPRLTHFAPDLADGDRWKSLLAAAFRHAFAWIGFGAKTAVGYGALSEDKPSVSPARVASSPGAAGRPAPVVVRTPPPEVKKEDMIWLVSRGFSSHCSG